MTIKEIKQHPDEGLLTPAAPVSLEIMLEERGSPAYTSKESWIEWMKSLVKDLTDTMNEHHGLGLAAPQIGVNMRVIVFKQDFKDRFLINPVIVARSDMAQSYKEGCLSVKEERKDVRRAKNIVVRGYTLIDDELV